MKKEIHIFLFIFLLPFTLKAHPGGNMITVGDHVLWSYISPVDDVEHHACVMVWHPATEPEIILRSAFPASDFMFHHIGEKIYILEQHYVQQHDHFRKRILKMKIGEKPQELWNWFVDDWRIGDAGFYMKSEKEIIFGSQSDIYCMEKGQGPEKYFDFDSPIKKIKSVPHNQILLTGEDNCWLTDQNGKIIRQWDDIIDERIEDAPLQMNLIFDADYKNGELLLAYWGKRSFDAIYDDGTRQTLLQLKEPVTPHWVAFYKDAKLLFSSKLIFDGSTPKPNLILFESATKQTEIWTI